MSSAQAIGHLHSPIRDLVLGATQDETQDFGKSEKDQAEVEAWIEKIAQGDIVKPAALNDLDIELVPRTYVVNNYLTAADIALYGALHPTLSQLQPAQYYSHPALTRYFDHIQNQPVVRKSADALAPSFSIVPFDIDNAPKSERKVEAPKKKEKRPAADAPAATSVSSPAGEKLGKIAPVSSDPVETPSGETTKPQKKEKKEKVKKEAAADEKGKKKGGESSKLSPDDAEPAPSMIDLRVGHIVDVAKHPDADSLYVEQIDFGEETGPRTVVSGLVNYIPIEQMRDKYLVGVCNLKPANMRGVKSFAMVLAATSKDGKDGGVELISPPPNSKPGDRVYFEGPDYENATPLMQLNPKKKVFETIQPSFTTLETREAAWVNPVTKSVHKIRTKNGVCLAPTFVGASLS